MSSSSQTLKQQAPVTVRLPAVIGLLGILGFFGGFGVWAASAPLAGAAVAPGLLVANGQNKVIQHFEGGIVKEIRVSEGEKVSVGTPLLVFDRTAAETTVNRLTGRRDVLLAYEARFRAERDGQETVTFPRELLGRDSDTLIEQLLDDQLAEFDSRLARHRDDQGILAKRAEALREEIGGIEAQNEAIDRQSEFAESEISGIASLLERGYATQQRLLALRRLNAELLGEKGENIAKIAATRLQIAETEQELTRLATARREEASAGLSRTRAELQDIESQINAAKAILDRVVLRSPVAGVIVKLQIHTLGEVIQSGQPLLEILPDSVGLLIEARLHPEDIDVVSAGQTATVNFSALDRRTTPTVNARIEYVSADRLVDENTRQPYYLARLHLEELEGSGIEPADLYPGMQVEIFILNGERTLIDYLVRPIRDSFQRAFREH